MRPPHLFTLLLLGLASCETTAPPTAVVTDRIEAEEWSLAFVTDRSSGTGRLRIEHRTRGTIAELHHVRLILGPDREETHLPFQDATRDGDSLTVNCVPHPDHSIGIRLQLGASGNLRVDAIDTVGLRSELCELTLDYDLSSVGVPDETWLPHPHHDANQVSGDSSFHTPVAWFRSGHVGIALLPDREILGRERRIPQALEIDRETPDGPRLRHGLVCHQRSPEGGFTRTSAIPVRAETLRFAHTLRLFANADTTTADLVFRELWDTAAIQVQDSISLNDASDEFFYNASGSRWLDLSLGAIEAGSFAANIAATTDGLAGKDVWYSMRDQSLRTAYGLALFARRTGNRALEGKAEQALEHALSAPDRAGLIPSIFLVDEAAGQRRWVLDSVLEGDPNYYHVLDIATTYYWMLRLLEFFPEHQARVLNSCRRAARFLRQNQLESGAFPSFFTSEFLAPRLDLLYDDSAETGSVARFLVEYGELARDEEALEASKRALSFVGQLLDSGKWLDAESTWASTSRADPRSGVPRQGTLGLIQSTLACFRMYRARPDDHYLRLGIRLLAQLSRYQQIWAPPWVANAVVGGFGVGNFDARWNDARQGLAALAFMEGYRLTQDSHWLDRGTAALHAAIDVARREEESNTVREGPVTSMHWGLGTACTTAEIARAHLGQLIVDLEQESTFSIDSVWITDLDTPLPGQISAQLWTHDSSARPVEIRFLNAPSSPSSLQICDRSQGRYSAEELSLGVQLTPRYVPKFRYRPPSEISWRQPWYPRVEVVKAPTEDPGAHLEILLGESRIEYVPLTFDEDRGLLVPDEGFVFHSALAQGSEIRSRLVYEVDGHTFTEPDGGDHVSTVSDFLVIDPGEGDEVELVPGHDSKLRRFVNGREDGRYAGVEGGFSYAIPIPADANRVEFEVRVAGHVRIRTGDLILHEDATTSTKFERNLPFDLADHRVWSEGEFLLTFEPASESAEIDVALVRYRSTGQVASTVGLGTMLPSRDPDQTVRVIVQPMSLIDQPLDVDRESLFQTFFGGADYKLTPPPNSQPTVGSVAQLFDDLSGGRTSLEGEVLPPRTWEILADDLEEPRTALPEDLSQELSRASAGPVDLVIAVLGDRPVPPERRITVAGREVPLVFLPQRGADGTFLSSGAAATAILEARYDFRPLATPEWGNFGKLALSGIPDNHLPPSPAGINLRRAGWSDYLFLGSETQSIEISPLTVGRTGYVLDFRALPGRGLLLLESRGDPGLEASGMLMYWSFGSNPPYLRDVKGRSSRPSLLRVSATANILETPFTPGGVEDLYQTGTALIPTPTLAGERLWEIEDYRPQDDGQTSLVVRYLATDLLTNPSTEWFVGDPARPVHPEQGPVLRLTDSSRIALPKTGRLLMKSPGSTGLARLFCEILDVQGSVHLAVGVDSETLLECELIGTGDPGRLQIDLPQGGSVWLSAENRKGDIASVELGSIIQVPRVAAAHQVRPTPSFSILSRNVHLMDDVIYDKALRLPAPGRMASSSLKTPVVLPTGSLALRFRAGLEHGSRIGSDVQLSLSLIDAMGTRRDVLLEGHEIGPNLDDSTLDLGLIEIPAGTDVRVEFLEITWQGESDLFLTDLAIVQV